MQNKTIHQHYVFQEYLRSWLDVSINQVWCVKATDKTVFHAPTKSILFEDNFYRIQALNTAEQGVLNQLCSILPEEYRDAVNEHIRQNNRVLSCEKSLNSLTALLKNNNSESGDKLLSDLVCEIDAAKNNAYESFYCEFESELAETIRKYKSGIKPYENTEEKREIILNICIQYFRTKNIRSQIQSIINESLKNNGLDISADKIALYLLWSMSGFLTDKLISKGFDIFILNNPTNESFITCDQPVVNLKANYRICSEPEELELFYPVSPETAILIRKEHLCETCSVSYVNALNSKIVEAANEIIVFNTEAQAREFSKNG